MAIEIYKDAASNSIFMRDANGTQFVNSLQATVSNSTVSITNLSRDIEIVSGLSHTEFIDENGDLYGANAELACDALNAVLRSTGTNTTNLPEITSSLAVSLTQGETLNYELTANFGVGYEWDLSNVSGVATVEGNIRKLIGGSSLAAGTYNIPVKAINYNGEDSETLVITVSTPPFSNTKSVNFSNNDWCGANAGILQNTLGRTGNGSGLSDAWSIGFWFKGGTANNASQTIMYFGNQDVTNQGYIQIKYNGSLNRLEMRYGSNNNRLNFATSQNSLPDSQWVHILITYDGGTTGVASGSLNDYYSRFNFFIDGTNVTNTNVNSHSNFGYNGSIEPQNFRIGRFNNGQSLRNNCRVDEVAVYNADVSSISSDIFANGTVVDLMSLSIKPQHWWRMGDGDTYPYLQDNGTQANCIFQMYNMTAADIVSDVPQ